jgi:hypothetical protein
VMPSEFIFKSSKVKKQKFSLYFNFFDSFWPLKIIKRKL